MSKVSYNVRATLISLSSGLTGEKWLERGDRYTAQYDVGTAIFSGPVQANNFEAQFENDAVLSEVTSRAISVGLLKDEARINGGLRAAVASSGRKSIKNSSDANVGYAPDFVICGTDPIASFMAGEDVDDAPEVPGLNISALTRANNQGRG